MAEATETEQRYSPNQVAAKLGISRSQVCRYMREYQETAGAAGLGPVEKLGRRIVRIPASAVNRFLARKRV